MTLNQTAREILQRNLRQAEGHAERQALRLKLVAENYAQEISELSKDIADNTKFIADLRAQLKD